MSEYLQLLKEATAPELREESEPTIRPLNMWKLTKEQLAVAKKLWLKFVEEDNNHAKFYREKPVSKNSVYYFLGQKDGIGYFDGDKLLGFAIVKKKKDVVKIDGFFVDPKHRGKGIGTSILKHVFKEAKKEGRKFVDLSVWENNKGAEKLYKRHGFKVADKRMRKFL